MDVVVCIIVCPLWNMVVGCWILLIGTDASRFGPSLLHGFGHGSWHRWWSFS
jgi:hypothetical protein